MKLTKLRRLYTHNRPLILGALALMAALAFTLFLLNLGSSPRAPRLKKSSGDSLYTVSNKTFSAGIGSKSGSPQISFSRGDSGVQFVLSGSAKSEPIKTSATSLTFPSVLDNTDLVYTTLPSGLKEELILHQKPDNNIFLFDLSLQNATSKNKFNNLYDHTFYDAEGKYLFHFEDPFAVDASGNRTDNVLIQIARDQQQPELYSLKLTVDETWLYDPARTYPISIDPTVVHDTTAEFAAGTLNRLKDTGSGSSPSLETYYHALTTDSHTVGHWHMNEANNDTCSGSQDSCDSSGNGLHATENGGVAINTTGLLNNSRSFDGSNDYLTVSDNDRLSFPNNIFTIEGWVKRNGNPSTAEYIILKGVTTWEYAVGIGTGGAVFGTLWQSGGATVASVASNAQVTNGEWHHFALVSSGNKLAIYIDGLESNSTTSFSGSMSNTAATLYFGDRSSIANSELEGSVDEIRISNVARSPEEVRASASRRPYSVYTSDVIDLTNVNAWNSLTWTELGVATGDGETLANSTGLVAQWNFNETSGTTADNAEGTSALDGALSGFDSTASQDADPDSSWTANNKRWGAGALQFDGTDSKVTVSDNSALEPTSLSLETWIKTSQSGTANVGIIDKYTGSTAGYILFFPSGTTMAPRFLVRTGSDQTVTADRSLNDGIWHHIVGTYDGTNCNIYIDGVLDNSASCTGTITYDTANLVVGGDGVSSNYFRGVIDSTRLYSRALAPAEIMSNYQAGNIEFQTRVGSDTSPDDGSWEDWSPASSETAISSYDDPYQYNTTDSSLVAYWPLDESADNSCSGGQDACDKKGSLHLEVAGTVLTHSGRYGNGRYIDGSNDYLGCTNANCGVGTTQLDVGPATAFSYGGWIKNNKATGTNQAMFGKKNTVSTAAIGYIAYLTTNNYARCTVSDGTDQVNSTDTKSIADNNWHHIFCTSDGTTQRLYVDGKLVDSDSISAVNTTLENESDFKIGVSHNNGSDYIGYVDEVRFYNGVEVSAADIQRMYLAGSTNPQTLLPQAETAIVVEGTASQKIINRSFLIDDRTVALWHLDETGGSGAYLKDSAGTNHGTPTGTALVKGVNSKGRSFNGSTDYISCTDANCGGSTKLDFNSDQKSITLEAWINSPNYTGGLGIMGKWVSGTGWYFMLSDGNSISFTGATTDHFVSIPVLTTNTWHHVAAVLNVTTGYISYYVNGAYINQIAVSSYPSDNTQKFAIGQIGNDIYYWNGSIDEVRISDVARSAEEIAESYRMGRDHYINKTINSTDLSGKTSLPFYVAADRPGTYLTATVGESAFANYQTDSNIVGMWRLDEQTGSGAYLKDASGNGNNATPTGTTSVQGKIGRARDFDGTTDYFNLGDVAILEPTSLTINLWARTDDYTRALNGGVAKGGLFGTATDFSYQLSFHSGNVSASFNDSTDTNRGATSFSIGDNNWHMWTYTYDGTTAKLYKDGVLVSSAATSAAIDYTKTNNDFVIGARYEGSYSLDGQMDEISISNTARTATEIRQAYENGLRTHPITIDFASSISHSNPLSSSNDLTFTLMATPSGYVNAGDHIYEGDKIIVRENYDGTEYLAQGTVDSINVSTGATTISSWDAGSTFPSAGFGPNSTVFKWQREYWPIDGKVLDSHLDAITNLTLRLTDGVEGRTIYLDDLKSSSGYLTTPTGSSITSNTGNRYFQYRAILTSVDEAVSATISAVTLDYVSNSPPTTPSLVSPADTATNQLLSPVLQTSTTDDDSDYLRYKIELCTNVGMTTGCQTFDQTSSQTGWSGQNAQTSTAYTSGTQASYTIQTPLNPATTYYWRSYAIDPAGTNTWSNTQGMPYSFTATTAPSAPTTPYAEGASNPTGIADLTPELSAIHNDSDSDAAVYYEIEVNTANDFTGTVMWDTGAVGISSLASGARSSDVSYAGTALTFNGATYYWRIRFTDNKGATGAWSATQNFTLNSLAAAPTLDAPSNGATDQLLSPVLQTTGTDTNSDYLRYKIELCTNVGMTTGCQTFDQTSSQTGWSGQNAQTSTAYTSGTQASYTIQTPLNPATTYYWRSYAIDPAGTNTWSNTQGMPYSFTTIEAPLPASQCRIRENSFDTGATIIWDDIADNEDNYEIQKSTNGGSWSVLATNLSANLETYTDSAISPGNTYRYRLAPYFAAGPTYGTWCYTNTLTIESGNFFLEGLNFNGLKFN